MAPRKKINNGAPKKASSSGNQNNHAHHQRQSQPSKFGIQHFFERHSQNQSQNLKKPVNPPNSKPDSSSPVSAAPLNPQIAPKIRDYDASTCLDSSVTVPPRPGNESDLRGVGKENQGLSCQNSRSDASSVLDEQNKEGNELNNPSQNTPAENHLPVVIDVDGNHDEEVQEVSPEVCTGKPPKRFKFSPGMVANVKLNFYLDCFFLLLKFFPTKTKQLYIYSLFKSYLDDEPENGEIKRKEMILIFI